MTAASRKDFLVPQGKRRPTHVPVTPPRSWLEGVRPRLDPAVDAADDAGHLSELVSPLHQCARLDQSSVEECGSEDEILLPVFALRAR